MYSDIKQQRGYGTTSGSGPSMSFGSRNKQSLPSRVAFIPGAPQSDLYGAINCSSVGVVKRSNSNSDLASSSAAGGGAPTAAAEGSSSSKVSRLKYGPPLLEIRRVKYSLYVPNDTNTSARETRSYREGAPSKNASDSSGKDQEEKKIGDRAISERHRHGHGSNEKRHSALFQHETILVSRGIPGLGGNVSSTCLDFHPLSKNEHQQPSTSSSTVVKCATGLTSGALCIHSISNLYNDNDGDNDDSACYYAPSSTVAHYAPRQQRPASSLAWRPNSNLVAIGLVGSGSGAPITINGSNSGGGIGSSKSTLGVVSGISSSSFVGSAHHPSSASAGVMGNAAAGGDRDFGTLVWDIEAQSSVVSGAGTVGGGSKGVAGTKSVGGVGKGKGPAAVPIKSE